jgi:hypothetical protein
MGLEEDAEDVGDTNLDLLLHFLLFLYLHELVFLDLFLFGLGDFDLFLFVHLPHITRKQEFQHFLAED